MNQKGSSTRLIILVIVILIGGIAIGCLIPRQEPDENTQSTPTLTKDMALTLVKHTGCLTDATEEEMNLWSEKGYGYCSVEVVKDEDAWLVVVTFNGLKDDSITAEKISAPVHYENEAWVVGTETTTQQCHKGRGHQDFSEEPCQ